MYTELDGSYFKLAAQNTLINIFTSVPLLTTFYICYQLTGLPSSSASESLPLLSIFIVSFDLANQAGKGLQ